MTRDKRRRELAGDRREEQHRQWEAIGVEERGGSQRRGEKRRKHG